MPAPPGHVGVSGGLSFNLIKVIHHYKSITSSNLTGISKHDRDPAGIWENNVPTTVTSVPSCIRGGGSYAHPGESPRGVGGKV